METFVQIDERPCCPQPDGSPVRPRRSTAVRILSIAILAGVAARCLAYVLNLPIYYDEAYLVNSVLVRDYGELLRPLGNFQVAPPVFCWVVKWCSELSDTDRVLRLLPLAAGLLSLTLFAVLCRDVLRGSGVWFALAVMSVSHVAILSSMRAKPYSTDLLVGVALTLLAWRWLSRPQRPWPLLVMAVLAPVFVWLSYTSVFVIGGVGLVLAAWAVFHRRQVSVHAWVALVAIGVLALASFGALAAVNLRAAMSQAELRGSMYEAWADAFPPLPDVPRTLWWLITTHTGRLYSYPVGEKNFGSVLWFACWCVGIAVVCRRPRGAWLLGILLAPQALLLAAAFAGKYPYGGHARISLFLAPSMCLLIGAGIGQSTGWLRRARRRRWRTVVAVVLLLIPIAGMVKDCLDALAAHHGPSVRNALLAVREQTADRDPVFCLNDQRIIAGGGPVRQIFEYYMERILGDRVRWAWDGTWPTSQASPGPGTIWVIECVDPDEPDAEAAAARATLRGRFGEAFDPDRAHRYPVLDRYSGEMHIHELAVEAPADHGDRDQVR